MASDISHYSQAHQSEVDYASPHRIIQMLMERFLTQLAQAKGAMERGEIELKNEHIKKAITIIAGLRESLDFEKGGEVAPSLESLYDYMTYRLTQANIQNSGEMLDEIKNLMAEIKSAWDMVPEKLVKERES